MKHAKLLILIVLSTLLLSACASQPEDMLELQQYLDANRVQGSLLLYDAEQNTYTRYCQKRCEQRFIPASTFKLLNAQIALETGVIEDENEIIPWDGVDRGYEPWNQDHNLRSGMEYSVVWFYQELARRIGTERMQHYVDLVGYGNQDISGSDTFWLEGNLRISQEEQIAFLQKLYNEELPFSTDTMQTVKDIIILEQADAYTLSGKTGWATDVDPDVGWFIGYVERDGNVYFFATNVTLEGSEKSLGQISREITLAILDDLDITY